MGFVSLAKEGNEEKKTTYLFAYIFFFVNFMKHSYFYDNKIHTLRSEKLMYHKKKENEEENV